MNTFLQSMCFKLVVKVAMMSVSVFEDRSRLPAVVFALMNGLESFEDGA